jgi:hypothetical protein
MRLTVNLCLHSITATAQQDGKHHRRSLQSMKEYTELTKAHLHSNEQLLQHAP